MRIQEFIEGIWGSGLRRYTVENSGWSTGRSTICAPENALEIRTDVFEVGIPVVVDPEKAALQQVVAHAKGLFG